MQFLFGNHGTNPTLKLRVAVLSSDGIAKCDENARSTNQKMLSAKTHVPLSVMLTNNQQKGIKLYILVFHSFPSTKEFTWREVGSVNFLVVWLADFIHSAFVRLVCYICFVFRYVFFSFNSSCFALVCFI